MSKWLGRQAVFSRSGFSFAVRRTCRSCLPGRTFERSSNRHGTHIRSTSPCRRAFDLIQSLVAAKPRSPARQAGPTQSITEFARILTNPHLIPASIRVNSRPFVVQTKVFLRALHLSSNPHYQCHPAGSSDRTLRVWDSSSG